MTEKPPLFVCVIGCLAAVFALGCVSKSSMARRYINPDSTAVYSTHPGRPFHYGYAYSREDCEMFRNALQQYGIRKGDVVADVGAASGWLEGVFSVMVDSVDFYVQDIDTHFLNHNQLNRVVQYYSSLRSTPQTNTFHCITGSPKSTQLPDGIFDKIIMHNTFHELFTAGNILKDLKRKLKPNGELILYDQFSNPYRKIRHEGCGIRGFKTKDVVDYISSYGYYLTGMSQPENSFHNFLHFRLNPDGWEEFADKRKQVEGYTRQMDQFNQPEVQSDSVWCEEIASELKTTIGQVKEVYPNAEFYLDALGELLLKDELYPEAIQVYRANVILFPDTAWCYDNLGDALLEAGRREEALQAYEKSLQLNPDNKETKEIVMEIRKELNGENPEMDNH
ncbi:MAG: tetratricopeptide repeat protein [Bacteroidetes bacterium]|nr:tetratricopeptide repeat protein [Bacteroidota bacterium]